MRRTPVPLHVSRRTASLLKARASTLPEGDSDSGISGLLSERTDYFVFRPEAELGTGHADISLEPLVERYPHLRTGYLIELKYLARGKPADEARVVAAAGAAKAQLRRYLADERLARQFPAVRFTGLAVVFHSWEMVFSAAVT